MLLPVQPTTLGPVPASDRPCTVLLLLGVLHSPAPSTTFGPMEHDRMNPVQSRLLDPPKLLPLGGQPVLQTPVVPGKPPSPPPLVLLLLLVLLPAMLGMRGGRLVVTAMPDGFHCAAANSDTELGCEGCLRLFDCRRPLMGLSMTAGLLVWPLSGARMDAAAQPVLMEWLRCCLAGGTTTEPSAAGAAAPLRDLTRCREAPSSARTGLMAR